MPKPPRGYRKRPSLDVLTILEVLRSAKADNCKVWLAAENRIAENLIQLRRHRAIARTETRPQWRAMRLRSCAKLLTDNRRVRRLIKTYASWQRPSDQVVHGAGY